MNITKTDNSITIEMSDVEQKILLNDLLDWKQWIEDAITNKVANCKFRLIDTNTKKLLREKTVESIPTDEAALLDLIFSQKKYKNRIARDKEAKIN